MNTTDVVKLARFLANDYPFNIRVTNGACPVCFKNGQVQVIKSVRDSQLDSPTSKFEARRKRFELWMELLDEGGLDPIQCINAYVPACEQSKKVSRFSYPLVIQTALGEPCKAKSECFPTCLICNTPMDQLPSVTAAPWTIPVHTVCCDPCGYISPGAARGNCCQTPALTIPKRFKDTLGINIRCAKHGSSGSSQTKKPVMALEVTPSRDVNHEKTASPPTEPPARPTVPKPKPKPSKPAKIDRVKERGCHDVAKLLWPDRYASAAKPEPKRAKAAHPRDEPISSKGPGAAYFYAKSHHDFSEPRRLPTSEDLAHEENEDKAGSCAGDGEERRPP